MDAANLDNSEGLGPDGSLSHAFSTFMIMLTTQPLNVLIEMHRVLQPGKIFGLAIWGERVGPDTLWEEAYQLLDPTYTLPAPIADPHAWRAERESEGALQEVGFKEVHTEVYKVPFEFEDKASYMRFWYGAQNPVTDWFRTSFKGSQEEAKKALEKVVLRERYNGTTSIVAEIVLALRGEVDRVLRGVWVLKLPYQR